MDFSAAQQEIDAILTTLEKAKRYSGLGPDDPAVAELERIMLTKVAQLEAMKTESAQKLESAATDAPPAIEAGRPRSRR